MNGVAAEFELGAPESAGETAPARSVDGRPQGATRPVAAAATAAVLLTVYGVLTDRVPAHWDMRDEVFLRLAILVALGAGAFSTARLVWDAASRAKGGLWNIGGRLDAPSWEDVRRMTLGAETDDALVVEPFGDGVVGYAKCVAAYLVLGCVAIEALSIVVAGPILPRLLTVSPASALGPEGVAGVSLELSANLTALLALTAAAVSIYFTHRQLQAKVKADSRQAWTVKLRTRIADFVALAGTIQGDDQMSERQGGDCSRRGIRRGRLAPAPRTDSERRLKGGSR